MRRLKFSRASSYGQIFQTLVVLGIQLVAQNAFASNVTLLSWNVAGNGQTDWSTNSVQVQAVGRIVQHLQPDIITFQEIPFPQSHEMTNFVAAYLEGFHLARYSGTDGILRSVILSRFPITREQKWLDGVPLNDFGYDGRFTRDLFEAEIKVPDWPSPLHVFTTHLKSGFDFNSVSRRAAEALAISNFVVNTYYPAFTNHPFVLTGDFNEDHIVHANSGGKVVDTLINEIVGLRLTDPLNPLTGNDRTFSSRGSLSSRLDYILPGGLLYSNLTWGMVFSTETMDPRPPTLSRFDVQTASDHLPVLVTFRNPRSDPFRITSAAITDRLVSLRWQAQPGRRYQIEGSRDFDEWGLVPGKIEAGSTNGVWNSLMRFDQQFFRVRLEP
jgi:endonuclease/exonuclease/phosphatase family metal-dependent hydrolase